MQSEKIGLPENLNEASNFMGGNELILLKWLEINFENSLEST